MDTCDTRIRAYKNGKTFDQCKEMAKSMNPSFKDHIEKHDKLLWTEILDQVDHDELIYKLTLKFLRIDGYDISDNTIPEVKKFIL